MRGLVPRPEDLETIEQQLVVHPEDSRVLIVVVKLKAFVRKAHQPEQTGQMKDGIGIVDVLAVAGTEVV
jgi:hypothetical protein